MPLFKGNKIDTDKVYDISELFDVFGVYQIIQYCLISLPIIFVTMADINYVFVAGDIEYRCIIPQYEDGNSTVVQPYWWPKWASDRCTKPVLGSDVQHGTCTNTSFTDDVEECTEWIYESNNTVVATLNLACQSWKVNLIGTIHNIGLLGSLFMLAWICDKYGRKPALLLCALGSSIGQLKVLMPTWSSYVVIEFLEATMTGSIYTAAVVLMLEISSKRKRAMASVLFSYFIYTGESVFACLALLLPYWKTIVHVVYTPFILFIVYVFLLHESPRWQIVNGRCEEAKKTLSLIAKMNKINVNHDELESVNLDKMNEKFNIGKDEIKDSLLTVLKSKEIIKRLFVSCVIRFIATFIYYGMMVNSVRFPGDKYLNFFLTTVMSYPGELIFIYLMNKFGRKLPLIGSFLLNSVLSIASGYLPVGNVWANTSMFLISKMSISCAFTGVVTYTTELFPTSVRGSLISVCFFSSRLGSTLSPLTPILNSVSIDPSIFFGFAAILAAVVLFLTPETKDLPLMDTVRQVEDSVKKQDKSNVTGMDNLGFDVTHL